MKIHLDIRNDISPEIADFSGARIYRPVWSIFQTLLAQVAVRATELHDPVLDALMLRMGLYDVKANERRELVEKYERYTYPHSKSAYHTPREAFAHLIDEVSGRGTWDRNPWVFAFSFELIK